MILNNNNKNNIYLYCLILSTDIFKFPLPYFDNFEFDVYKIVLDLIKFTLIMFHFYTLKTISIN